MPFVPLQAEQSEEEPTELNVRTGRSRVLKGACISDGRRLSRFDCLVRNISSGGAKLQFHASMMMPSRFWLYIYSENIEVECERVWMRGLETGVKFLGEFKPLSRAKKRLWAPI
jgi:hypothetical protein